MPIKIKHLTWILLALLLSSCEPEETQFCYPSIVRFSSASSGSTVSQFANYILEDKRIDYIAFSETKHYYSYDASGRLKKIERQDLNTYRSNESRLSYEEDRMVRVDEYEMVLDFYTLESTDSTYTGRRELKYNKDLVTSEKVYMLNPDNQEIELAYYKEYSYDDLGNLVSYTCFDREDGDTLEAYTYTYDIQSNPFNGLSMYFEGESYVNNRLEENNLLTDELTEYRIAYLPNGYPDQVLVYENSFLDMAIRYEYTCE